ncbi:DUF6809 family protein [Caproiciproducens sp. R1]|uniref:DUF6809 family protein n=1 Tax=Caproiciproducens sp. R1 TaxID=3435000 RepID=UPI0040349F22
MNFYETRAGHTFYEYQLPQLISTLKELTTAITQAKAKFSVRLPADVPPDFLKKLYYGNFEPDMQQDAAQLREYNNPVMESQKRLKKLLAPEAWEQVEEYRRSIDIRTSFELEQAFETGFRTAAKMIAAGLSAPPCNEKG